MLVSPQPQNIQSIAAHSAMLPFCSRETRVSLYPFNPDSQGAQQGTQTTYTE